MSTGLIAVGCLIGGLICNAEVMDRQGHSALQFLNAVIWIGIFFALKACVR